MKRLMAAGLALGLTLVPLAAASSAEQQAQPGAAGPAPTGSQALMQSMQAMNHGMAQVRMTGDTDRDFALMMREHHRGALTMAQAELDSGKDPALKRMAEKIIADQTREIETLDAWIAKHPAKP